MNTDKDLDMLLLRSQPRAASIKQYYDAATRLREPTIRLYFHNFTFIIPTIQKIF